LLCGLCLLLLLVALCLDFAYGCVLLLNVLREPPDLFPLGVEPCLVSLGLLCLGTDIGANGIDRRALELDLVPFFLE
jgi:hypothetical protein